MPDDLATVTLFALTFQTSLKKFIIKFGERVMLIYDAILSEKKVRIITLIRASIRSFFLGALSSRLRKSKNMLWLVPH